MMKKKLLSVALCMLAAIPAVADVEINETNFPDANFRSYLLSESYGADGVLTDAEIAHVTGIYADKKGIASLQGIEHFTALQYLSCSGNQLTALDVSKNTALAYLRCYNNQLTTLDVSKNTALTGLECDENQLTTIDVSRNTALEYLNCYFNQLTTLDLSKNTALTDLNCFMNRIKGEGMEALVASLPTVASGTMRVVGTEEEQNVMTTVQVAAARAKGWQPMYWDGSDWAAYDGSDATAVERIGAEKAADKDGAVYDLGGRRLQAAPRGAVVIQGGRKTVVR